MTEQPEVVEQTGRKSECYREIMPNSFWGGIRPGFIEAIAVTTQMDAIELMVNGKQRYEHTAEISLRFTPQQAKTFVRWMMEKLILYEKIYGKIVLDEDAPKEIKINDVDLKSKIDELIEMAITSKEE